ncbi:hypothetical protein TNCV_3419571 [Trichonephila clavipes]|nr:hypothetical protein TNCV_3419571 [Trichonephila clavipes]
MLFSGQWSPRLPDISPLGFSVPDFVKNQVYIPQFFASIPKLKSRICAAKEFDRRKYSDKFSARAVLPTGHLQSKRMSQN